MSCCAASTTRPRALRLPRTSFTAAKAAQRQQLLRTRSLVRVKSVGIMAPADGKRARGEEDEAKTGAGEYPDVMSPRPMSSAYLPGLTRSVYERDHAVITQESRVWCG